MLARPPDGLTGEDGLPAGLRPAPLVVLEEQLRPRRADTIAYFGEQGVAVKVISGDNPVTVGAVARPGRRAGRRRPRRRPRARRDDPEELADVIETRTVFGRVDPPAEAGHGARPPGAGATPSP